MKVTVIKQFGAHRIGETHSSRKKQDIEAFNKWIECGWAEEEGKAKAARSPKKNKAITEPDKDK